mmetsp:Transcript_14935/g.17892  ORF Transcript_14935/g.17892 Transcript_14935/m.17892 type:complete len:137 (+) Transcript_14935:73-483(+)|eukprot:jgi/Bigna1/90352/estExt_fgenesh1_pg.C_680007
METETFDAITQIQAYFREAARTFETTIHDLHESKGHQPSQDNPYQIPKEQKDFVKDRAERIFRLMKEADLLLGSLPTQFDSEEKQLNQIKELEEENRKAGKELKEATKLAEAWQRKVSLRIQQVATEAAVLRNPTM